MVLAAMSNHEINPDNNVSPSASNADDSSRLVVTSAEILRGKNEIWIEHGNEMYRLCLTRAGKLLLSK